MIGKIPYGIAILGMAGGILIAILFGMNEDVFKNRIQEGLSRNDKIQSIADPATKEAKLQTEASKNWRYYQRFHFHATGIGSMSMALLNATTVFLNGIFIYGAPLSFLFRNNDRCETDTLNVHLF